MLDNIYYIISAANIQIDTLLKGVNTAYANIGAVFGPVFNVDGTKVLVQVKWDQTPPASIRQNALFNGPRLTLIANLALPEWQLRINPPDSLTASYFAGTINIGQYLTQVRAITPTR